MNFKAIRGHRCVENNGKKASHGSNPSNTLFGFTVTRYRKNRLLSRASMILALSATVFPFLDLSTLTNLIIAGVILVLIWAIIWETIRDSHRVIKPKATAFVLIHIWFWLFGMTAIGFCLCSVLK